MSGGAEIDPVSPQRLGMTGLTHRVSVTLRAGVLVSAILFTLGLAWHVALAPVGLLSRATVLGRVSLADAFVHPSDSGLLLLGAVVLAATPFVRVALSFGYFARQGDRPFAGLTLFVLLVLLATISVGVLR